MPGFLDFLSGLAQGLAAYGLNKTAFAEAARKAALDRLQTEAELEERRARIQNMLDQARQVREQLELQKQELELRRQELAGRKAEAQAAQAVQLMSQLPQGIRGLVYKHLPKGKEATVNDYIDAINKATEDYEKHISGLLTDAFAPAEPRVPKPAQPVEPLVPLGAGEQQFRASEAQRIIDPFSFFAGAQPQQPATGMQALPPSAVQTQPAEPVSAGERMLRVSPQLATLLRNFYAAYSPLIKLAVSTDNLGTVVQPLSLALQNVLSTPVTSMYKGTPFYTTRAGPGLTQALTGMSTEPGMYSTLEFAQTQSKTELNRAKAQQALMSGQADLMRAQAALRRASLQATELMRKLAEGKELSPMVIQSIGTNMRDLLQTEKNSLEKIREASRRESAALDDITREQARAESEQYKQMYDEAHQMRLALQFAYVNALNQHLASRGVQPVRLPQKKQQAQNKQKSRSATPRWIQETRKQNAVDRVLSLIGVK